MFDDTDIGLVRKAVASYFRAAAALAEASILTRLAAQSASAVPGDGEAESDQAWLLDRAATYRSKTDHMSRSGTALLNHVWDWVDELDATEIPDTDLFIGLSAQVIEDAASAYRGVVEALVATPLGDHPAYRELLEELRQAARFLQSEAAVLDDAGEEAP